MGEKLTKTAEIIEHKGVQILLDNLSGLKGQELTDALKAVNTVMRPRNKKQKRLGVCKHFHRLLL